MQIEIWQLAIITSIIGTVAFIQGMRHAAKKINSIGIAISKQQIDEAYSTGFEDGRTQPECFNSITPANGGECHASECTHHCKTEPLCGSQHRN